MKQIIFLTTILCLASHSVSAMEEREQWPARADITMLQSISAMNKWPEHFKDLVCPGRDEPIDAQDLLNANPFWKHVAETVGQEEKNKYLEIALCLPGSDPVWKYRRKAIGCALATGADPDIQGHLVGTALYKATLMNDYHLIKFALQCNANPNIKFAGIPLLFCAKSPKIATLLIEHKADVLSRDNQNETVLHQAASYGSSYSPDLIPCYIQQGCDVNAQDAEGNTPIMKSVYNFDRTKFRLLLENGADINITKDYYNTEIVTVWDIAWNKKCFKQATEVYDEFQQKCKAYGLLVSAVRLFTNKP